MSEWLRQQKTKNPSWFWALIAVSCWTVIVLAMGVGLSLLVFLFLGGTTIPSTSDEWAATVLCFIFGLTAVAVLVVPAWYGVLTARRRQGFGGGVLAVWGLLILILSGCYLTGTVNNFAVSGGFDTIETVICGVCGSVPLLVGAPPLAIGVLLRSGWQRSARMLEDAKESSGTLICFECGHHNPVGQTECEQCGAWVPQTAKARRAYGEYTEP